MNFKFIHTADIHLDSPLRGLERYEGAPVEQLRSATRDAFINLCDLCLQQEIDFLVIAGDLYDGDWPDYQTGLFFTNQMSRLRAAGISVYIVSGNHDAESEISRNMNLPENVYSFSTTVPETQLIGDLGVAIHGCGYATKAVTQDLSVDYPAPIGGYYNIGLLHTSLDGREGHAHYAPSSQTYLQNKGYDYWALGHVHQAEIISQRPYVIFPGNIQGRHIRETGAKGCTLVTVQDSQTTVEFCQLDVLQWIVCGVDATDCGNLDELNERAITRLKELVNVSDSKLYAVRFMISGATTIHHELRQAHQEFVYNLRSVVNDLSRNTVWIEKVKFATKHVVELDAYFEEHPTLQSFFEILSDLGKDAATLTELTAELQRQIHQFPAELTFGDDAVNIKDQDYLEEIIEDAGKTIVDQLIVGGGE